MQNTPLFKSKPSKFMIGNYSVEIVKKTLSAKEFDTSKSLLP